MATNKYFEANLENGNATAANSKEPYMKKKHLSNALILTALCLFCSVTLANPSSLEGFPPQPLVIAGFASEPFSTNHTIIFLSRLVVAIILGFFMGLSHNFRCEKGYSSIKTYSSVTLGSAAFSSISAALYLLSGGLGTPLQILGKIILGIGFLCAGVFFKQKLTVTGLSTAATLWSSAAVGMAAGLGFYGIAVMAAIIIIILHLIQKRPHNADNSTQPKTNIQKSCS